MLLLPVVYSEGHGRSQGTNSLHIVVRQNEDFKSMFGERGKVRDTGRSE